MVLVLKMLYNRSGHLSVYTVQLFTRKCVYGGSLLFEKAPLTIEIWQICETWRGDQSTLKLIFQASVSAIFSNKPSFET